VVKISDSVNKFRRLVNFSLERARVHLRAKLVLERVILAQKEQQSQKNTKKAPAKSLKEKRLDKQAKAADKK
jgi:hypothetical protein